MLSFVKNWFAPKANPIGVDLGSDSIKLAQVVRRGDEHELIAAATADVPSHVRQDAGARVEFLVQTLRDLLAGGSFVGRRAVLALPAASMFIQHLRLPKMEDDALTKALPWEARGKLPIDPSHAVLRHHVAGDVYQEQQAKNEVIVMAAGREVVNQFLAAAARARLEVVGMTVEPKALVDCFSHVHRRKSDEMGVHCYVDLGSSGTRVIIARGTHIQFARAVPVGGDHLTRAVSQAMKMTPEEAKLLRVKMAGAAYVAAERSAPRQAPSSAPPASADAGGGFALLAAGLSAAGQAADQPLDQPALPAPDVPERRSDLSAAGELPEEDAGQFRLVEQACAEPLNRLVEELDLCRRYHESTFQNQPVERLIFVGGEAKHKWLCQYIAREVGIAAQVGDPLVRMARSESIGAETGIDRKPQPNWAVAVGLSLGESAAAAEAA